MSMLKKASLEILLTTGDLVQFLMGKKSSN